MTDQTTSSIFSMSNFFDELCIIDTDGIIRYYSICPSGTYSFTADQIIGKHIFEVYPEFTAETSELYQVLKTGKPLYSFSDYCLNYKGAVNRGYFSVFPIYRRKQLVGAAAAMKFLGPDYENERIQIQEHSGKRKTVDDSYTIDDIITVDPRMIKLKKKIRKVSDAESSVLIQGRTGTGKEIVAQALHYSSKRASGPFISQNCSAIPGNLLESTLFGTDKGSFTGAITSKGLFEFADGGTLFLDEINSMELSLQGKLLKAIESKSVRHLGGHENIKVNVRIVAAINEDPFEAIEKFRLRSDLFYRLNIISFHLPDLKDRLNDIGYLTDYYIDYYNQILGMHIKGLDSDTARLFSSHNWPGNVRELRNIIEGAFAVAEGDLITSEDVPDYLLDGPEEKPLLNTSSLPQTYDAFMKQLETAELKFLKETVSQSATKAEAAKKLGITRQLLNYKLSRLETPQ